MIYISIDIYIFEEDFYLYIRQVSNSFKIFQEEYFICIGVFCFFFKELLATDVVFIDVESVEFEYFIFWYSGDVQIDWFVFFIYKFMKI